MRLLSPLALLFFIAFSLVAVDAKLCKVADLDLNRIILVGINLIDNAEASAQLKVGLYLHAILKFSPLAFFFHNAKVLAL